MKRSARLLYRSFRTQLHQAVDRCRMRTVPVDRILMSGECSIPAGTYARLTGDLARPSRSITQGPHVEFLREFQIEGADILKSGRFERTAYFRNAAECIELTGHYFPYVKEAGQIRLVAERFVRQFVGGETSSVEPMEGHSPPSRPVEVRPIWRSDCFEMVDGNHRAAMAMARGQRFLRVRVGGEPVQTPAQALLMDVLWQEGRHELYQPVPFPEVSGWPVVRRCSDRFGLMEKLLANLGLVSGSYLDVGSSYGWFVARMKERGFDAQGVDRDPAAIRVGQLAYGLESDRVSRGDIVSFLQSTVGSFDVVSCFSVLHHFVLGRMNASGEQLLSLLDRLTGRVMFFETGQNHEDWFAEALPEWDVEYTERFLRRHTTFRTFVRLGEDADAVGQYRRNYRRTLWACMR